MKLGANKAVGWSVLLAAAALGAAAVYAQKAAPASAPGGSAASAPAGSAAGVSTVPGMPPVVDAHNLYSEVSAGKISPTLREDLERIYVPNLRSNDVYVVDPNAMKVVERFKVGIGPQHIVPAWDMRTLWVTNNAEGRTDGTLTPVDPNTGKPKGPGIAVDPALVRSGLLGREPKAGAREGVYGDPRRSSAELGQLGVDQIVAASVAAIRAMTGVR